MGTTERKESLAFQVPRILSTMDPSRLLGVFIAWPALALVPAVTFGALYAYGRRRLVLITAIAWLAYLPYELSMKLRILCSGECNIRVDLLVLYPVLAVLSVASVYVALRAKRRDRPMRGEGPD
jgi:hypothetical protein